MPPERLTLGGLSREILEERLKREAHEDLCAERYKGIHIAIEGLRDLIGAEEGKGLRGAVESLKSTRHQASGGWFTLVKVGAFAGWLIALGVAVWK
jgi:hypothetical protein